MSKTQFTFPVGYYEFHKDQGINFQLNRYYSFGYARFEDMKEAGQKINSFKEWKIEMLKLAEKAGSSSLAEMVNVGLTYVLPEEV